MLGLKPEETQGVDHMTADLEFLLMEEVTGRLEDGLLLGMERRPIWLASEEQRAERGGWKNRQGSDSMVPLGPREGVCILFEVQKGMAGTWVSTQTPDFYLWAFPRTAEGQVVGNELSWGSSSIQEAGNQWIKPPVSCFSEGKFRKVLCTLLRGPSALRPCVPLQ